MVFSAKLVTLMGFVYLSIYLSTYHLWVPQLFPEWSLILIKEIDRESVTRTRDDVIKMLGFFNLKRRKCIWIHLMGIICSTWGCPSYVHIVFIYNKEGLLTVLNGLMERGKLVLLCLLSFVSELLPNKLHYWRN